MVDLQIVCSMCGDVGFSDKLFRCNKCHNRFQHSYCSNYYGESPDPVEQCDWCQIEERSRSSKHINRIWSKSKSTVSLDKMNTKSEFSGDMNVKQKEERDDETTQKGKSTNGTPSPRPTTRRYKLLKDVMC